MTNPQTRWNISPRIDYQLTPNNSLTARYQYFRDTEQNDGVGQFNLAQLGTNDLETEQTFQVTDTQIIRSACGQRNALPVCPRQFLTTPVTNVSDGQRGGAFTGNGSGGEAISDIQNRFEVQNITYINRGKHAWKVGGRLRTTRRHKFHCG